MRQSTRKGTRENLKSRFHIKITVILNVHVCLSAYGHMANIEMYLKHLKHLTRHHPQKLCAPTFQLLFFSASGFLYQNIPSPLQESCVEMRRAGQHERGETVVRTCWEGELQSNWYLPPSLLCFQINLSALLEWQIKKSTHKIYVCAARDEPHHPSAACPPRQPEDAAGRIKDFRSP